MQLWPFILSHLEEGRRVVLLYVLESEGSSPGRKGFCMAVAETGVFEGTIGGGIMEVKLIELAKSMLQKGQTEPLIKEQYHDKAHTRNRSGLICSGRQKVGLVPLGEEDVEVIRVVVRGEERGPGGEVGGGIAYLHIGDEEEKETAPLSLVFPRPRTIHIFGAGHVGMALAQQMQLLGYRVLQYDDREDIYDLQKDRLRWPLRIIDYQQVGVEIDFHPSDVVAIVSFSYRSDKLILQQLYQKELAYIGMMGSDHKIVTLKQELAEEGIPQKDIAHVHMPIGLPMYSKTAAEIAVSIAGQVILEANKNLPTGRTYKQN